MFPYMRLIQAHKWIFIPLLPISVICTFRVFPVGINSQGWEKVMVSYWYSLSKLKKNKMCSDLVTYLLQYLSNNDNNPFASMSDQDRISPYNIHTISTR